MMDKLDKFTLTVQAIISATLVLVAVVNKQWGLLTFVPLALLLRLPAHMQREQRAVQEQMRLEMQSWLLRQFGLPFTEDAFGTRPPSASHVGALKSHRLLREQWQLMPPGKDNYNSFYHFSARLIVVDEQNRYWLALYSCQRAAGADKPITQAQPPAVLPITELRARRALFNDPPAYEKAFGEAPTRAALNAWRKANPGQEDPPEPPDDWPR